MESSAIRLATFRWQRWLCLGLAFLSIGTAASAQEPTRTEKTNRSLGHIDIIRIRELHHITDIVRALRPIPRLACISS